MSPEKIATLRQSLKNLLERRPDALSILSATAGIPKARLRQIALGEGAAVTQFEFTTIDMLRNQ